MSLPLASARAINRAVGRAGFAFLLLVGVISGPRIAPAEDQLSLIHI